MEKIFDNSYALITGASAGIGKCIAHECAGRGMNLFLVALPGSGLVELASELRSAFPVQVESLECDLTTFDAHSTVYSYAKTRGLVINTLINNAGIGVNGRFESMSPEDIDRMIMLNMRATTLLTSVFIHDLIRQKRSYILNVASMASFNPLPGKSIYAASKAYVMFFSKALRTELKNSPVSVTSVFPFGVPTNDLVKERIARSGFLAKKTVMSATDVARISVNGMLKGRNTIIPGKFGMTIFYSGLLVPQGLLLKIMEREIQRAPR